MENSTDRKAPYTPNVQNEFLKDMITRKVPVILYLMNGFQMRGRIKGFDGFSVTFEADNGVVQLVYKHAISTISPNVSGASSKKEEAESQARLRPWETGG